MVHFELCKLETKTGWLLFGDGGALWQKCAVQKKCSSHQLKSKKKIKD